MFIKECLIRGTFAYYTKNYIKEKNMRKCFALSVASLLLSGLLFAQTQVTGSVTDANTGE